MEDHMKGVHKKSGRTLFALGLGNLVDSGESQSMGVMTPIITAVFGVNLAMIGIMETLRSITQTVSAPFWGYAADRWSRKKVLFFGTGIWGVWTLLVGLMPTFNGLMIIRIISGLGLGCLMPATFSLLGDHFPQEKRGRALGLISLVGLLGTVIGVLALGFVASPELWKWGFIGLGIASIITGFLILIFVEEPTRGSSEPELQGIIRKTDEARYKINVKDMISTLKIPTIWAAILQGITGSMPWVVMSVFFINWMVKELNFSNSISFSDPKGSAPLVFAFVVIGAAISNFAGGIIGDFAEKKNPKFGRTIIGQFSVFVGVPLMYVLIKFGAQMSFGLFLGWAFMTALLIGWPGTGAKQPMMQAVVPPEKRSSAYSMVNVIEGGLSAFASLIAGALSVKIGLTNALLWTIPFPWIICGIGFTLFYFTYPKDAAKIRVQMADRREELIKAHGES
jgi:MFS family permease